MKKILLILIFSQSLIFCYGQDKNTLSTIETNKKALAGTNYSYKATILTSNFSLPVVKFNRFEDSVDGSKGSISFFNSVGAGLTLTGGEMREIRDKNGEIASQDFTPTFGVTGGFLFSSSTGDESKNSFAPFLGVSILDFQLGLGWELGTLPDNYKRSFFTVSYNIPIYKIKRGAFYILKFGDIIDDTNISTGRIGSN